MLTKPDLPQKAAFDRFLFKKSCTSYAHGLNILIKILGPEDQALSSPQGGIETMVEIAQGKRLPGIDILPHIKDGDFG